jgi:hypothetical protein
LWSKYPENIGFLWMYGHFFVFSHFRNHNDGCRHTF